MERKKDTYVAFEEYCMLEFHKDVEAAGVNKHKRKRTSPVTPIPLSMHKLWFLENTQEEEEQAMITSIPDQFSGLV